MPVPKTITMAILLSVRLPAFRFSYLRKQALPSGPQQARQSTYRKFSMFLITGYEAKAPDRLRREVGNPISPFSGSSRSTCYTFFQFFSNKSNNSSADNSFPSGDTTETTLSLIASSSFFLVSVFEDAFPVPIPQSPRRSFPIHRPHDGGLPDPFLLFSLS